MAATFGRCSRKGTSPLVIFALGFVVSLLVGLVFGLNPAMKAAALQPVDAKRHE